MTTPHMHLPPDAARAWDTYWRDINGEDWLTAKALVELSPALLREAASWIADGGTRLRSSRDLVAWVRDVDDTGRGWSSTESRLFRIVAALLDPYVDHDVRIDGEGSDVPLAAPTADGHWRRCVPLIGLLDTMGSWEGDVWRILTEWGTGGNNREHRGRHTVTPA